jgi:hypothetical protein
MPARPEVSGRRTTTERRTPIHVADDDELISLTKADVAKLLACSPWLIDRERKKSDQRRQQAEETGEPLDPNELFPEPYWLAGCSPRWFRSDIQRWLQHRHRGGTAPGWTPRTRRRARRRRRNGA